MNKSNLYIIAKNFTDNNGAIKIGGIETYIQELAKVLLSDFTVYICQLSAKTEIIKFESFMLLNVKGSIINDLVEEVEGRLSSQDLVVFSTEQWACNINWVKTIVIQHGIYWDLESRYLSNNILTKFFPTLYKWYVLYQNISRIRSFKNIVCVDYIYPIWLSTLSGKKSSKNMNVIPNFSNVSCTSADRIGTITSSGFKVLFARRFVTLRGVSIAVEVAKKILHKYPNVEFSFIGSGPLESEIVSAFVNNERVNIYQSPYSEMINVIDKHDIVIIPSLGSEGSSLIALEAMARGKILVASSVGGLTNVIIDGFNGKLVKPIASSFIESIDSIIDDPKEAMKIRLNSLAVAKSAFSKDIWSKKWRAVIENL